jgi:hypothetical protein
MRMTDELVEKHLTEWKKYLAKLKSITKKDVFIEYRIESVERLIVFNSK